MSNHRTTVPNKFKTFSEQAEMLLDRGMQSSQGASRDALKKAIEERLHYIGYYRFSAYWYPFREADEENRRKENFKPKTYWETIVAYYMFDRRLRNLIFDAIARIEVSLRNLIAYYWAEASENDRPQNDPRRYLNRFSRTHQKGNEQSQMDKLLDKVNKYYLSSPAECAKHYREEKKVAHARLLPVWVFMEFTTIGNLSNLLSFGLKTELVDRMARESGFQERAVFDSAIAMLTDVRNTCAHQGRMWNRRWLSKKGKAVFKEPRDTAWQATWHEQSRQWRSDSGGTKLFLDGMSRTAVVLTLCHCMLKKIAPASRWDERLQDLLEDGKQINRRLYRELGFSVPQWWKHPLGRNHWHPSKRSKAWEAPRTAALRYQ